MNAFELLLSGHFYQEIYNKLFGVNGAMLLLFWTVAAAAAVVTFAQATKQKSIRGFFAHLVPAGTARHPSARADFLFWISRRVLSWLLVVPLALSTVTAGHAAYSVLAGVFGPPAHAPGEAGPIMLIAFTVTMFVAYDLSYYLYHVLQHRIPLLWELHKVHHSAEVLVGVTKDRVHPLDELMNQWWNGLIPGTAYGVWLFFALDPAELTIFGLNVYFIRNTVLMMDFVRHTHMKLSYGRWLNQIFLCPHYHQLHHSVAPEHWDRNFGLALTVWDWLFGTLVIPKPGQDFAFGLQNGEAREYQSMARLYYLPLLKMARLILRPLRALALDGRLALARHIWGEAHRRP